MIWVVIHIHLHFVLVLGMADKMPDSHIQQVSEHIQRSGFSGWMSWLWGIFLMPLSFQKVRELVFRFFKSVFRAFVREKIEGDENVTQAQFSEHKDGDKRSMDAILHGLDQTARISQDAAIRVEDAAKEMREDNKIIRLGLEEHRRDMLREVSALHDKMNATNEKVAGLQKSNEVVIDLAKKFLKEG